MKAVVYESYGGLAALQVKSVPKPAPSDDEVLVKVHAVSINDWDWGKMDGSSTFNKLTSGWSKPKHSILGSDIAGTVEAVGKNVSKFLPGDEVYGDLSGRWGGLAEFVCAQEKKLAKKPAGMSFEEAASIPQAAMLAVQGLIDKGQLQKGQHLLINGAGGGVGTFGIQIAKLIGAYVTVVDSREKLEMLRALGAEETIDYTKTDFTTTDARYDLILDVKTNRPVREYFKVLKPNGMYVTVGGSMSMLFRGFIQMPFFRFFTKKRFGIVMLKPNKDLDYINQLFTEGKIKPVIDGRFQLEDVPEAFRIFSEAKHKGKLVITVHRESAM